jgi:hypothetical protein
MALIVVGALLLMICFVVGWTSSNLMLLSGLIIIVLGVMLHVRQWKCGWKY